LRERVSPDGDEAMGFKSAGEGREKGRTEGRLKSEAPVPRSQNLAGASTSPQAKL